MSGTPCTCPAAACRNAYMHVCSDGLVVARGAPVCHSLNVIRVGCTEARYAARAGGVRARRHAASRWRVRSCRPCFCTVKCVRLRQRARVMSGERIVKAALVIGINYVGQSGALAGCHRDACTMHDLLTGRIGVEREHVTFMVDGPAAVHAAYGSGPKQPTGSNIMRALHDLASLSFAHPELEEVWFHYSGHGSYLRHSELAGTGIAADAASEDDGRHETLVPVDWERNGMILDDMLNHALGGFRRGVRIIGVVDACHSETAVDLRYRYVSGTKHVVENPNCSVRNDCIMISGCTDLQTSADAALGPAGEYAGAMTSALAYVLGEFDCTVQCFTLLRKMREFLKARKFTQTPQITCSKPLSASTFFTCYNQVGAFSRPCGGAGTSSGTASTSTSA